MNPSAWIERHAGLTPDKPALVCGEQQWSYARLLREVERLAGALAALGVRHGERRLFARQGQASHNPTTEKSP